MGDRQLVRLARRVRRAVLYQDRHVMCVDKWPQLVVQGGTNELSVANVLPLLAKANQEEESKKGDTKPPFQPNFSIVHRLDKDTSGVLVVAKHEEAARILNDLFATQKVRKTYHALTLGAPYPDEGRIDIPLAFDKQRSAWTCVLPAMGAEEKRVLKEPVSAVTNYRILDNIDHHIALVELKPETGRKHQLRLHCAEALSCPIVGDTRYGPGVSPWLTLAMRTPARAKKLQAWTPQLHLHAARLVIPNYAKHFEGLNGAQGVRRVLDIRSKAPASLLETVDHLKLARPS